MQEATARVPADTPPTIRRAAQPIGPAVVVAVLFAAMIALSIWYLTRPVPLVIQSEAALAVAQAELARVRAGFRAETIATRKAEVDRAEAEQTLAQKTFDRTR